MHPGGVLWISSDSDDRINKMGAKIKNPKNSYGFQQNPKNSLDLKINPVTPQNVILTQKVIILIQNVIKISMHNVIIFQLKM